MNPLDSKTDLKHILEDRPLLLLNKRLFAVRYVKQLLALGTTSISTKYALPIELWNMVFEIALLDGEDDFCWVQAASSTKKLLHCQEIIFTGKKCGEYTTTEEVDDFERFMNKTQGPSAKTQGSRGEPKIQQKGTFAMLLPSTD